VTDEVYWKFPLAKFAGAVVKLIGVLRLHRPIPSEWAGSAQDDILLGQFRPEHERDARAYISYSELIFARNSPFDFVLLNLSISSSIASTGDSGFRTLRSTQMRVRSSFGISSSSFRVPER
jgi:hypothetical protein